MSRPRRPPNPPSISPRAATPQACAECGGPLTGRQRRYCSAEHRLVAQARNRKPPPAPDEKTLLAAARTEDRLEALRVLRDKLAKKIDETDSARDLNQLSSRMTEVLTEIGKLEKPKTPEVESPLAQVLQLAAAAGSAKPQGRPRIRR